MRAQHFRSTLPLPTRFNAPGAALFAALAFAAAGCSSHSDELIRVGNRTITVEDYKSVARGNESAYPGSPDSAKRALLQDLLSRQLMLREADERGLTKDPAVIAYRRQTEDEVLWRALGTRFAPRDIGVSEGEVRQLVAWRDTASHLLVIYTLDKLGADAAAAELRRGTPFAAVADRFNPAGIMPPGGDLGFLTPGSLVAPLDRLLRTVPVGRVIGPVEAPGEGWFVIEVTAREYRPQPPLQTQAALVHEMLRQRKQRLVSMRAFEDLKREYHLAIAPDAAPLLFRRYQAPQAQLQGLGAQTLPPTPSADDPRTTLATWDGGTLTLADALSDLTRPDVEAPPWNVTPLIASWVERRAVMRIGAVEARRRRLQEEPDVHREIEERVNNYILQSLYNSDIVPETDATEADVRAFYESVKDRFQRLDAITVETVTTPDSAAANRLALHGGHAPSLEEALKMAGLEAAIVEKTIVYPNHDPVWAPLQALCMGVPPGGMGGPVLTKDGWLVFRVKSKIQQAQDFEKLPPELMQVLRERASEMKRDTVLRAHTEHYAKMYHPVVHPERLARIPWPIGGASAAVEMPTPNLLAQ